VAVAFIVITVLVVVGAVALLVVIKNRKEAAAGNGGLPTAAVAVKVCAQSFFHPPLMVPCLMVELQGIIGNYRELQGLIEIFFYFLSKQYMGIFINW